MKRVGWLILCVLLALFISFISLGITALNFDAGMGVFLWLVATSLGIWLSFKLWKRKVSSTPNEGNHWQGWQKVDHNDRNSDADTYVDESFDYKPWHERKDILWQGKRKAIILYQDRHGVTTEREITMHGIMPNQYGELTLRAMCHLRDDWRTFYIDRIQQITTARKKVYDDFSEYMNQELGI